jgi:hypothetical protein
MAVPTRSAQINRVADFLSDDANADRTAEELAGIVVNGIYDMWTKELKDPPLVPHVGMAFKVPYLSTVNFVGWMGEEFGKDLIWVINATTDHGFLLTRDSSLWTVASASSAKIGGPGKNAENWTVGQRMSISQRINTLEILAVGVKTVLMRNLNDLSLWAESNANLKRYYKKEVTK